MFVECFCTLVVQNAANNQEWLNPVASTHFGRDIGFFLLEKRIKMNKDPKLLKVLGKDIKSR